MNIQTLISAQASTETAEIISIVVVVLLAIFIPTFLIVRKKIPIKMQRVQNKIVLQRHSKGRRRQHVRNGRNRACNNRCSRMV